VFAAPSAGPITGDAPSASFMSLLRGTSTIGSPRSSDLFFQFQIRSSRTTVTSPRRVRRRWSERREGRVDKQLFGVFPKDLHRRPGHRRKRL